VIVCTPPAQHAAHTLTAVAAGAGALVEKPLCTTLEDADRLVAAAEAGARIAYAENLIHAPAVQLALAHAAQLGGVDLVEVRAIQPRPTWGDFLTEAWGGGVLFDLGAHPLAIALLLAAPARPVEVQAVLSGADDHPVDEHAEVMIRFDTGAYARVVASWRGDGAPIWDAQASAPDGVVRLELLPMVLLERNGAEVRLPDIPDGVPAPLEELGYRNQLESFVLDLADGRVPQQPGRADRRALRQHGAVPSVPRYDGDLLGRSPGAAFGRSILDLTCAAYASAGAGGDWVELPFTGPRNSAPLHLWRP
jgi:predicted dehydrogenase